MTTSELEWHKFSKGDQLCSPHAINVSLVWVGGQLQGGVHRGQREHAPVKRLLRERVVGRVMMAWHDIDWNGGLKVKKRFGSQLTSHGVVTCPVHDPCKI